jgi:hypothetical protein
MTLENYLKHRRTYENCFRVALGVVIVAANSITGAIDVARYHHEFALWQPFVWSATSVLVWLLLLPAIHAFDARFPLARPFLRRNFCAHLCFTVPLSLVHVVSMVVLRKLCYSALGEHYDFGDWPLQLLYEYLKDALIYGPVVAVMYLYRLLLLRWQGEASLLAAPDVGVPAAEESIERPQRILVRKLGKEFLISVADIEWLEASGNYINLHVGGRVYPLRETMAGMLTRLDPSHFARVHRSHIVNLDCVVEIQPSDSGDATIRMRSSALVPFGRRHRTQLNELFRMPLRQTADSEVSQVE